MKTTIPFKSFDLQALLNAVADFIERACGEEFYAATITTKSEREELYQQHADELPRYERGRCFPELGQKLKAGETLVVSIAAPYAGEPVSFVDGSEYEVEEDDESLGGDADSCVLFLDYDSRSGELTVESGMECSDGALRPPSLCRCRIGPLEKPARKFVKRFVAS